MPPSSRNQPKPPSLTTRLLEIAQRPPLFLSQDRQPFVVCPSTATAHPLFSLGFSDWLLQASERHLGLLPTPQQIGRVVSTLDAQARAACTIEQVHTRTAKIAPNHYQIDLGHPDHSTIEVTGKQWTTGQSHAARFHRIETSDPLPIPEPSVAKLHVYLELLYGINTEDADKLAHWLGQAVLPDQKPPILLLTGESSPEAAAQLRSFIDPAFHATMPLPANPLDLAQQAIENRVLAYCVNDQLSVKKIRDFNTMQRGMSARLRHASRKHNRLFTSLHRPIIIASEVVQAVKICNQQLTIEIKKYRPVAHAEILGPILDVVVQIVGQPVVYPEPLTLIVPALPPPQVDAPEYPNTS